MAGKVVVGGEEDLGTGDDVGLVEPGELLAPLDDLDGHGVVLERLETVLGHDRVEGGGGILDRRSDEGIEDEHRHVVGDLALHIEGHPAVHLCLHLLNATLHSLLVDMLVNSDSSAVGKSDTTAVVQQTPKLPSDPLDGASDEHLLPSERLVSHSHSALAEDVAGQELGGQDDLPFELVTGERRRIDEASEHCRCRGVHCRRLARGSIGSGVEECRGGKGDTCDVAGRERGQERAESLLTVLAVVLLQRLHAIARDIPLGGRGSHAVEEAADERETELSRDRVSVVGAVRPIVVGHVSQECPGVHSHSDDAALQSMDHLVHLECSTEVVHLQEAGDGTLEVQKGLDEAEESVAVLCLLLRLQLGECDRQRQRGGPCLVMAVVGCKSELNDVRWQRRTTSQEVVVQLGDGLHCNAQPATCSLLLRGELGEGGDGSDSAREMACGCAVEVHLANYG
mmetsp:Transcript_15852/g.61936  ORF Transcript_15852/g.61936 Transcript_15852/m.61936 type:complete len:454 (+) Transcript_15852:1131-2492(+)